MNEQLRKAIDEATESESIYDYAEAQAKLLCVIELLVKQRNKFADCCDRLMPFDEAIQPFDAELIAALEQEKEHG